MVLFWCLLVVFCANTLHCDVTEVSDVRNMKDVRDESQQRVQHVLPGCFNKWPVGSRADGLASTITMLHLAQGRLYPHPTVAAVDTACNTHSAQSLTLGCTPGTGRHHTQLWPGGWGREETGTHQ